MNNDKIVTPSFCYILAANFLLFFAFYLILPILPFYLKEEFMIGKSMIGFILSCYTLAALCIRPFAGYLLDTFARRPLYLVAYFIFTAITRRTRFRLRHGDSGRKYDTDRHLALLPPWGRYWLLRPSQ